MVHPLVSVASLALLAAQGPVAAPESPADAAPALLVPPPSRSMSLPEALACARAHQPSLRTALARVRAAQAEVDVATAQWLPSFGATAQLLAGTANNSTASYLGVPDVDLPRIGGTKVVDTPAFRPSASTLAAVGFDQEVFDFGRIAAQVAVADAALASERLGAEAERLRVELLVKDAFYSVLGARAVLAAAEDAYARSAVHRDMARAAVKSGLHAPIELTRAEADLTRFDVARVQATGSLRNAQTVFAAAAGVPDRALDAGGDPGDTTPLPPLDEALRSIDARDPVIRTAAAQLETQRAIAREVAARSRPELFLSATFSGRAGGATPSSGPEARSGGWLPETPNWHAGLVLRWPLLDPVLRAQARSAHAREDVAASALDLVRQHEVAALQRAYVRVQVAHASLVALERATAAARANYAQADARFKSGLASSLEVADAEAVRSGAEIQLAIGRFQLSRARAVASRLLAEGP